MDLDRCKGHPEVCWYFHAQFGEATCCMVSESISLFLTQNFKDRSNIRGIKTVDVSITPKGSAASRIASLLFHSACLFSSQKINEHALIQLEGKKKARQMSPWSLDRGGNDVEQKGLGQDPKLIHSHTVFYGIRLSRSYS